MRFLLPLLSAVLFSSAVARAQEQSPTPTPPEASPTPSATPAEPAKDSAPAPEATPSSPAASPSPAPGDVTPGTTKPDVIPMEGEPSAAPSPANSPDTGAPLDTTNIAPSPRTDEAMPDDAFTKPNAVIPDESTPQAPAPPQAAESAQEKARQLNIRYKEIRVTAEKDPKIAAMYAKADAAKSEEDRRAAFREYYRMLFKKIAASDPTLQKKCDEMEAAYLRRLAQVRLEPTIPLNPPPTPEPLDSH